MQFDLYPQVGLGRDRAPYLLELQSNRTARLRTVLVCPVVAAGQIRHAEKLVVPVDVHQRPHLVVVPELFAIDRLELPQPVANLAEHRYRLASALELLFTET